MLGYETKCISKEFMKSVQIDKNYDRMMEAKWGGNNETTTEK